ncbi:MAG: exodeoxyribonuclease VII large subunit [Deltaproteobacteria bacterium]|jgi:exodeoxyribonuclease VII large subunit|nr:exodeoxyribonuclease VII large subunit [Deltaproteobacteria bacterium]
MPTKPRPVLFPSKTLTPTQVADRVKASLESELGVIWVDGEVASLARAPSGHVYFTLKDSKSLLKAVVWRFKASTCGASALVDGLRVLARGTLTVYGARSEYQLMVDHVEPKGEGALRRAFEALKKRLEKEGLFAPERKRPLPFRPRRVALLASPDSAAATDFLTTAFKRCRGAWISLCPVRVQGSGAAEEMAAALEALNAWGGFDLAVLTRGGGSLEDLWAFNEEVLVRAVAASRLPTLAAVGHSTDSSLVESAADARAITPTAAAELAFPDDALALAAAARASEALTKAAQNFLASRARILNAYKTRLGRFRLRLLPATQRLDELTARLAPLAVGRLRAAADRLEALKRELAFKSPRRDLGRKRQETARLAEALKAAIRRRLEGERRRLKARRLRLERDDDRLKAAVSRRLEFKRRRLERADDRLSLLSPLAVLTRGYALAVDARGRVIRSSDQVELHEEISLRLATGSLKARVTASLPDEDRQ